MSEQIIAYGATVERSTDGTTYEAIPECKGVAVPAVTTEYQEVTSLDSPNGFREYVKGLKDAGEITVPAGYTSAGYAQQISDQNANGAIYYRVTMPLQPSQTTEGDVFEFRGFPTPELEANDLGAPVNMNINLRLTGDVTWTAGT
ncbi:phage tail protein [Pontibaca salina]|uniref:Phage tail protein n=1 Tax=Pontibaca salina TaxID=2795731 RepID=A0A934HNZ4_9RHOB|nr:phage tail tube protein [Pontibaca salina]MBI6628326.1 hypothetical protein [Pontibaca salina]